MIGHKRPLRPKEVWAIRARLDLSRSKRDLALFNLAIDSKLHACDLVVLKPEDVCLGGHVREGMAIIQKKTERPVQFEIAEQTRKALEAWLAIRRAPLGGYLFPGRFRNSPHLSTRQYAGAVHRWVQCIGLDTDAYGTHSTRRTKSARIYRQTGSPRAVKLLLGHSQVESAVRYLGIAVDNALNVAEQIDLLTEKGAGSLA